MFLSNSLYLQKLSNRLRPFFFTLCKYSGEQGFKQECWWRLQLCINQAWILPRDPLHQKPDPTTCARLLNHANFHVKNQAVQRLSHVCTEHTEIFQAKKWKTSLLSSSCLVCKRLNAIKQLMIANSFLALLRILQSKQASNTTACEIFSVQKLTWSDVLMIRVKIQCILQ